MIDEIPTPFILIDAETVRQNVAKMAAYTKAHGLQLRPHTKTHKSLYLGKMQLDYGAIGLTVAKPGEAEVMAEICDDILMAYPAVDPARGAVLARLAARKFVRAGIDSTVAADCLAQAAREAGSTIGVLIDLDVGHHRTGVQSPADALALAQQVEKTRGLRLDGILFFPGHIAIPPAPQGVALAEVNEILEQVITLWRQAGLEAKMVSGGSTPTAFNSHMLTRMTEIRPGTYIFNDMNCVRGQCAAIEECAAQIIATVVSTAVPGQIVLDAGTKTLTSDRCGPAPDSGHGYILELPEAKITKLSEEHAQVDVRACPQVPAIGQRVRIIPNHICPCINLQENIWWKEAGQMPTPMRVDARGKVF